MTVPNWRVWSFRTNKCSSMKTNFQSVSLCQENYTSNLHKLELEKTKIATRSGKMSQNFASIELGSGCGLVSICLQKYLNRVIFTDKNVQLSLIYLNNSNNKCCSNSRSNGYNTNNAILALGVRLGSF